MTEIALKQYRQPTPKKITNALREGNVEPAVRHGRDGLGEGGLNGCLEFIAKNHPELFGKLLIVVMRARR